MNTAYIQTHSTREDGTRDSFATVAAEVKTQLLPWQKMGLQYTATGYGSRIPTSYMVKFNNRWRRVYCCIFSNIGTLYIGNRSNKFTVNM